MKSLKFEYTDHSGETKIREVQPKGLKFDTTPHSSEPQWLLEATDKQKNEDGLFVLHNVQRIINDDVQRFFCVTVYVVDRKKRFLMLLNRKLNKWVPPGGKVDRNETPDEAAVRECFEETGVKIELNGQKTFVKGGLICPHGVQLNTIVPDFRDHVDLIYSAMPVSDEEKLEVSEREASDIGWFSLEEVLKLDTFPTVIQWCEFFSK